MTRYAYGRVSTDEQNLDLQLDAFNRIGIAPECIFTDMESGAKDDRAGLHACLETLTRGDDLYVWRLDRLGRSLISVASFVQDLTNQGIGFKILEGMNVDTTTPEGKLAFNMQAAFGEYERDLNIARTMAGLRAAWARGKKSGRKFALSKGSVIYIQSELKKHGAYPKKRKAAVQGIMSKFEISKPTLYRYVDPKGALREHGIKVMKGLTGEHH